MNTDKPLSVAVLIPCYNEELAISLVIDEVKLHLPLANIYVFDNNSTDQTAAIARAAGATVLNVVHQGKGSVVRRMFADIDADIYLLTDGDATYDLSDAQDFINRMQNDKLDMIVGTRVHDEGDSKAYRLGHQFGNRLLTQSVAFLFGNTFTDMLSGYRVFSKRYVKSFPAASKGFEIETELTIHALELRMPCAEMAAHYRSRPAESFSKLNTYQDGIKILTLIMRLFITERPFSFFSIIALGLALMAVILVLPLGLTYIETGLVPRLPTAVMATGMMLLSALSFLCGLILNTVTLGRQEVKRLHYLSISRHSH